ncbi:sigma-70 family RNA polymerase sigma factor [candidate division KSB1 bacterium]|nr:sigma-70 family RNA polymerase sigma factor [candidate division KSB1 bacterium]
MNGNTQAFEAIVDRYQEPIFNAALRMVDDYDDAQDIAQLVFVKAFEKLNKFNPKYKFFSWIYRMVINESINFLSQRKQHEDLNVNLVAKERTPDQQFENLELSAKIQTALMALNIEYRAVVILKHFEGFSYKEIGYILDTPEKTVKSRLFTARQQLREVLVKQGVESE